MLENFMIQCKFYNYNIKEWNEVNIDLDLNVYPCCIFYHFNMMLGDPDMSRSLREHKIEDIVEFYKNDIISKIENNTPYKICKQRCDTSVTFPTFEYNCENYE